MSDEINIGFKDGNGPTVVLYMHWGGSIAKKALAQALVSAHSRWLDAPYATRIVVSHMIGQEWREKTGYGLFATNDLQADILVDWEKQKVTVSKDGDLKSKSFSKFIEKYGS